MDKSNNCTGLWAHALDDEHMVIRQLSNGLIKRVCTECGYTEALPHSSRRVEFVNHALLSQKQSGRDESAKQLLQPLNHDGTVNDDFTEAYGYNPADPTTNATTPAIQGGEA